MLVLVPKVSQDHLDARRRQILEGARRCFSRHGYEGATVRRMEEATGLSRGAIFHHFRDKDALFLALAQDEAQRMADVVAERGLVEVMRELLEHPEQRDWLGTRLEVARRLRTDAEFRADWSARAAEITAATRARLERQRAAGKVRDDVDPEILTGFLELVLDGLVAHVGMGLPTEHLGPVLDLVEASVRQDR